MRRSAWVLGLAAALAAASCASGAGGSAGGTTIRRDPNVISQAELAEPSISVLSAQDAIQRLRPGWFRARGASSVSGGSDQRPAVMLNESMFSIDGLGSLRASDITSARYISGPDATTLYGTGYVNGVVKITTGAGR